ncbi:MAG: radical SAM protein [Deltaproteobacteria bacterium]|jgi:radical SAM protein with 4Fe4S-binding SPASM domain|nr:radical SAM protein [Deltaproteobacteria bacterium]
MKKKQPPPRLVAWETTAACNLACRHCRAEAEENARPDEMDHEQGRTLLAQLAQWQPKPMVILSGGEPLLRPDIMELAALGTSLGLRMLLSTNGTLLTPPLAAQIQKAGVARVSVSLDGAGAGEHDEFRGVPGAFDSLCRGTAVLREAGVPFQINTTVTAGNLKNLAAVSALAEELGAAAHHVFLLVPVGRARQWEPDGAGPQVYEEALWELKRREEHLKMDFKATCAPQYNRIARQMGQTVRGRGCLGGQGFMFVSADGEVRACGYLPLAAGHLKDGHPIDIYEKSPLFQNLRDREKYEGRCRNCQYWSVCGGCRARAHAAGNYLGPEPLCPHDPFEGGPRQI